MSERPIPLKEAGSAVVLLLLLALPLLAGRADPAGGPLGATTALACLHAALLAPAALPRGALAAAFLPALLALPALAAASYGRGAQAFAFAAALLLLSCAAGAAARRLPASLYQPLALLQFLLPFGLGYLATEFGVGGAMRWRELSPLAAALRLEEGAGPATGCLLLLAAWPVAAIARRRG